MKKIIIILFLALVFQRLPAQFKGVLHYESDISTMKVIGKLPAHVGKVFTDIYASGLSERIDSKKVNYKIGSTTLDNSTAKEQDNLLLDFGKQHETRLYAQSKVGTVTKFTENPMAQMAHDYRGTVLNIQNLGNEMINDSHCIHYLIIQTSSKNKDTLPEKREIWITKDLGDCHIWYVGAYLYWFDGNIFQQKLAKAGASGVIVKWPMSGDPYSGGMLVGYKKGLTAQIFAIPSGYKIIDRSNYSIPNQK